MDAAANTISSTGSAVSAAPTPMHNASTHSRHRMLFISLFMSVPPSFFQMSVFLETEGTQTSRHPGRVLRRLLSKREAGPFPAPTLCESPADALANQKPRTLKRIHGQNGKHSLRFCPDWPRCSCLLFKYGRCSRFPLRPEPSFRRGPGSIACATGARARRHCYHTMDKRLCQ